MRWLILPLALGVACGTNAAPSDGGTGGDAGADAGCGNATILDNASFETDWSGFTDWASNVPPTGSMLSRANDFAFDGQWSVRRSWVPNPNGDVGAQMMSPAIMADRVWVRWHMRLTAPITSIWKYMRFADQNIGNFGGIFMQSGADVLGFGWDLEDSSIVTTIGLGEASVADSQWHTLEVEYWRRGDPSGFPSAAFWWDGKPQSLPDGTPVTYDCRTTTGTCNKSYWSGGRLYAGERQDSTSTIGYANFLSTLNGGNTTTGQVNVDAVSIGTCGPIGP